MSEYNGYKSYAHWNTALWINNDEGFHDVMLNEVEFVVYQHYTLDTAVEKVLDELPELTPDREKWQRSTLKEVMLENYAEQLRYS